MSFLLLILSVLNPIISIRGHSPRSGNMVNDKNIHLKICPLGASIPVNVNLQGTVFTCESTYNVARTKQFIPVERLEVVSTRIIREGRADLIFVAIFSLLLISFSVFSLIFQFIFGACILGGIGLTFLCLSVHALFKRKPITILRSCLDGFSLSFFHRQGRNRLLDNFISHLLELQNDVHAPEPLQPTIIIHHFPLRKKIWKDPLLFVSLSAMMSFIGHLTISKSKSINPAGVFFFFLFFIVLLTRLIQIIRKNSWDPDELCLAHKCFLKDEYMKAAGIIEEYVKEKSGILRRMVISCRCFHCSWPL